MFNNHLGRMILYTLMSVCYKFAIYLYKLLKIIFKPIIHLNPRFHRFAVKIVEAIKELIQPPEISPEVGEEINLGTISEKSSDSFPTLAPETGPEINSDVETRPKIPKWLISEWKEIHEIEPRLFPEKWLIDNILFYSIPNSRIGDHYLELCNLYGKNISHVFLIPWVYMGGAEIVTMNYIQALLNNYLATGITLISTVNTDSPWANKLPDKVRFIEFGKKYSHLSEVEQEKLLTRLLLQMSPKVIHNINSSLGYNIFMKYGNALNHISNLYASLFCTDITQEGKHMGYSIWYLPECFDNLKAVAVDNRYFSEKLVEVHAFDENKIYIHYQPIQINEKHSCSDKIVEKEYLDIVWAGRLDIQKRPDILTKIARACLELPLKFHVYGIPVIDSDIFTNDLTELENLTYYGVFDKLHSLPIEKYDIFLYTSQWDGLPTILLDAITLKLPIIASNVGGISELIISGETGFLIDPYDDIDKYVDCLVKIYNDRSSLSQIVDNAFQLVSKRHSWESFVGKIKAFPGYTL